MILCYYVILCYIMITGDVIINCHIPDGRCFLAGWDVSKSVTDFKHDRPKPNLPKRKGIYPFRYSAKVS